jgi:hypothetical protein
MHTELTESSKYPSSGAYLCGFPQKGSKGNLTHCYLAAEYPVLVGMEVRMVAGILISSEHGHVSATSGVQSGGGMEQRCVLL